MIKVIELVLWKERYHVKKLKILPIVLMIG